jgi:hypothetical protein
MKATNILPENYRLSDTLDIMHETRAVMILNVAGLVLLAGSGWVLVQLLVYLRPAEAAQALSLVVNSIPDILKVIAWLIIIMVAVVVFHEGLHGSFFWLFTRERPKFAVKTVYAYAAAPGFYLPRPQYLLTGLAPFIFLTLAGLVLLALAPMWALQPILLFMVLNIGGSVGDLMVAVWLMKKSKNLLARDQGDLIQLYTPRDETATRSNLLRSDLFE